MAMKRNVTNQNAFFTMFVETIFQKLDIFMTLIK